MTNKEKKDWLSVQYPLTVMADRYDGTYSGAKWLAFPLDYDKIPSDVDASDPECAQFWKNYKEPVGKGAYASDAVVDLIQQMRESEPEESEDERIRKQLVDIVAFIPEANFKSASREDCHTYLEKHKEQKPAEWSEKHIADIFEKVGLAKIVREQGNDKLTNALQDAMLELSKVGNTEWSEEDEKRVKQLIYDTEYIRAGYEKKKEQLGERFNDALIKDCDEQIAWLKSLRPKSQKEIYQAAKYDLAIKFMNYLDENRPEGKMSLSNGECEDIDKAFRENNWAKILRYAYYNWKPSDVCYGAKGDSDPAGVWKPSKEQIRALKYAVDKWEKGQGVACPSSFKYMLIKELYEQLKKL